MTRQSMPSITKSLFSVLITCLIFISCDDKNSLGIEGYWMVENNNKYYSNHLRFNEIIHFDISDTMEVMGSYYLRFTDTLDERRLLIPRDGRTYFRVKEDTFFLEFKYVNNHETKWQFEKQGDSLITFYQYKGKTNLLENSSMKDESNSFQLRKIKDFKFSKNDDFDQVILSRSGCYGMCPIMDVSFDFKEQYVHYYGNKYVVKKGFHNGTLNNLSDLKERFAITRWDTLKTYYYEDVSDQEAITLLFIKNDKIIKSIYIYGFPPSISLEWVNNAILPFINSAPLEKVIKKNDIYPRRDYYAFNTLDSGLILTKAESYLLYLQLQKAQKVNTSFEGKYTVQLARNYTYFPKLVDGDTYEKFVRNFEKVETDGRYYKIYLKGEKSNIYDLGYNFIDDNPLNNNFEARESIEKYYH